MKKFDFLPKSIRGWFSLMAWASLLLMLVFKSECMINWGMTPTGPYGEDSYRYFDAYLRIGEIKLGNIPSVYTVTEDAPPPPAPVSVLVAP